MNDFFEPGEKPEEHDPLYSDPPSEEDLSALIHESMAEVGDIDGEITNRDISVIHNFLTELNVKGAEEMTTDEASIIWSSLVKDASLIEDFTFLLMDRKGRLNFSEYPMAISVPDLVDYSIAYRSPQNLRAWFVSNKAVPGLAKYGMDEKRAIELTYSEVRGKESARKTRFLGWIAGQGFMREVLPKLKQENKVRPVQVADLATMVMLEVMKHRDVHKKRSKKYNTEFDMEREALEHSFYDVTIALEGLYKLCERNFLGEQTQL